MPFAPELSFLYLFLKKHLEDNHKLVVERADDRFRAKPVIEKIRDYVDRAEFVIADITFLNPNVFYELGLSHAKERTVILLTQDDPANAPLDIRHHEFIRYDLNRPSELVAALDWAVSSVLADKYAPLYAQAVALLAEFNKATGANCEPTTEDEFQQRAKNSESVSYWPMQSKKVAPPEFLLPRVMPKSWLTDPDKIELMNKWVDSLARPRGRARGQVKKIHVRGTGGRKKHK
jgi:nucleoside 2-deoxyribosyltransferase